MERPVYNTMVGPHGQELRVATSHTSGVVRDAGMNEFGLPAHMTSTIQGVKQQLILKEMDERREIVNQMVENNLEAERRKKNPKIAVDLGEANDVASVALLDFMVKRGSVVLNQGGGQSGYEKEQAALQDKFRKQRLAKTMKKAQKKVMVINRFKGAGLLGKLGGAGLDKGSVFGKGAMDAMAAKAEEEKKKKKQATGRKAKQLPPIEVVPSKELMTLEAKNEVRKLEDFESHRLLLARIQRGRQGEGAPRREGGYSATSSTRGSGVQAAAGSERPDDQVAPARAENRRQHQGDAALRGSSRDVVRKIAAIEDMAQARPRRRIRRGVEAHSRGALSGRRRYRKARTKRAAVAKSPWARRRGRRGAHARRASWDELLERHGSGDEATSTSARGRERGEAALADESRPRAAAALGDVARRYFVAAGLPAPGQRAPALRRWAMSLGPSLRGLGPGDGSLASRTVGSLEVEDDDGCSPPRLSSKAGLSNRAAATAWRVSPSRARCDRSAFKGTSRDRSIGRGSRAESPAVAVRTGGDTTASATAERRNPCRQAASAHRRAHATRRAAAAPPRWWASRLTDG